MKTYYTVYETTNLINGKIYIGVHKTNKPKDSYLGSGNAISNAIKKYGKKNFTKKILYSFDTLQEAYNKELEIVTKEFCLCSDNYNLVPGGPNGNILGFNGKHTPESIEKMKAAASRRDNSVFLKENRSKEWEKKHSKGLKRYNKNKTPEQIKAKSQSLKEAHKNKTAEEKIETGKRISKALRGKEKSSDHKRSLKEAKALKDNSHTEDSRFKISKALKGKKKAPGIYTGCQSGKKKNFKKLACPHCLKEGSGPAMYKYHMDNCKSKN